MKRSRQTPDEKTFGDELADLIRKYVPKDIDTYEVISELNLAIDELEMGVYSK